MERTQWKNGPHVLEFEPPDIYHCRVLAPVTADEVKETMRVLEQEIIPKVGPVFFVMHMEGMGGKSLSPEARRYITSLTPSWKAAVLIGGNPVLRSTVDIVMRALNLMSRKQAPTRMVETVEEAYAIVEGLRAAERIAPTKG